MFLHCTSTEMKRCSFLTSKNDCNVSILFSHNGSFNFTTLSLLFHQRLTMNESTWLILYDYQLYSTSADLEIFTEDQENSIHVLLAFGVDTRK